MSCDDGRWTAPDLWSAHRADIERMRAEGLGRRRISTELAARTGREISDGTMQAIYKRMARESAEKVDDALGPPLEPDPIRRFATPRQLEALDAYLRCESVAGAAEDLGITPNRLRSLLSEARQRAAKRGWAPAHDMEKTTAPGFSVKGTSTYYRVNPDGTMEARGQWVKTKADEEHKYVQLLDALQDVLEPMRGAAEPLPEPRFAEAAATAHDPADLLAVYPMGDPHIGMYAWAAETGEDFDLEIGERNLFAAADLLVAGAPPAEQALVVNLGDFFHSDTNENRTARSGHALDVDTRWAKVLAVGIRVMRRIIDRALEKHRLVKVINEIGNHDDHSALMLSLALAAYYEREPRVVIDTSPDRFHWYRFGECLLGVTHGNGIKIQDLPLIMAHDRASDWGETKHRYWYTGHVHSDRVIERGGVVVETFRTLAARDAYAHHSGYRSGRDMKCDVLHRRWGRVNRNIVGIEQLRGVG